MGREGGWFQTECGQSALQQRTALSQSNDHLHYLLQLPPVLQITRIIYKAVEV